MGRNIFIVRGKINNECLNILGIDKLFDPVTNEEIFDKAFSMNNAEEFISYKERNTFIPTVLSLAKESLINILNEIDKEYGEDTETNQLMMESILDNLEIFSVDAKTNLIKFSFNAKMIDEDNGLYLYSVHQYHNKFFK